MLLKRLRSTEKVRCETGWGWGNPWSPQSEVVGTGPRQLFAVAPRDTSRMSDLLVTLCSSKTDIVLF
jgi:hypothetical protein